eukprot:TRINITY_DN11237_c0_g1_i2.p3 TRINITY_DN11237_c0_g1~~TRINITY_DN11237_c0_g1_i2.p3  ORF type:complete len:133 (-),score=29.03 TRINITY_DN11237_c0_g1_i2:636-1034(-)
MCVIYFFFLMIRRPPRSTHCISSAASDVYKRQVSTQSTWAEYMGGDRRVLGIGQSGVGVEMGQKLAGISLLGGEMRSMEKPDSMRGFPIQLVDAGVDSILQTELAADQEIEVDIDPLLSQAEDKVIQTVQRI